MTILLHNPIWNNGSRYFGVADYRVMAEPATVTVECDYTNKEGIRLFPKPLKISKAMVLQQATMILKPSGTLLYLVPLNMFEVHITKAELTEGYEPKPQDSITIKQEVKPKQGSLL